MLVLIKGAGDLATGVAVRLKRAGMDIVMTDLVKPSAIRRSVAFSEAMYHGTAKVESITAVLVPDAEAAKAVITREIYPYWLTKPAAPRLLFARTQWWTP